MTRLRTWHDKKATCVVEGNWLRWGAEGLQGCKAARLQSIARFSKVPSLKSQLLCGGVAQAKQSRRRARTMREVLVAGDLLHGTGHVQGGKNGPHGLDQEHDGGKNPASLSAVHEVQVPESFGGG